MTDHKNLNVLFVGLGASRVCWYRCVLPAMYLNTDWVGISGQPPYMQFATGYVKGGTQMPAMAEYDVVVVQQPRGRGWFDLIKRLKAEGVVVLAEYDDFVHGIRKQTNHDFSQHFKREHLKSMELCLRACDGLVCSTEYIARRYSSYVQKTYVCENGLDMARYRLSRPARGEIDGSESVTIMWSGATGHSKHVGPWLDVVERILRKYPQVCLATIGQPFANKFAEEFENRIISIPFAALETYPAAMMLGDIALAPAGEGSWAAGKSDLRVMEASALGIPVIADPHYHNSVVEGHTGFVVTQPGDALERIELLVEDRECRHLMGANARQHADSNFDMAVRRESWKAMLLDVFDTKGEYVHAA